MARFQFTPISRVARILLAGSALLLAGGAQALDLTVEVLQARSTQGQVSAGLYAGAATWLGTPLQGQRAPAGERTVLVFRDLPAGRYALSVFHDENGNGKLDRNIVGMPTEPYGFSRDAQGHMGPASFDDAALDLQADTTVTVHLH